MKKAQLFEQFIKEDEAPATNGLVTKVINFKYDFSDVNKDIGLIEDSFTLAIAPDSTGVFALGDDVEKFSGLKLKEAEEYNETPDDAYIYGLCNIMNGGKDWFVFLNGNRLAGAAAKVGAWPAFIELFSHEAGIHGARKIATRAIAKNKYGIDCIDEEWVKHDYGNGEYYWPAVGDAPNEKNPIVMINEEDFATLASKILEETANDCIEMAKAYLPEL
ncbi:MAG: hypothetical protein CMP57_03860 [Flavobacteriales bacterium]|nr:hypothetical protein [Flavobacteriales bacterium]|tara:strand:+ start:2510 stop:3163 length:654 start_codon:yes stop_codon:yes gene_type:complete